MNLQTILQLPFEQKCEQLAIYTDQCMLSTLESVFPVIVSDIFGSNQPGGFYGWNLCKHSQNLSSRDFVAAFNFLSPNNGTIFKIIYTLLKDFNIKYRFPFDYLPLDIQRSIKDGTGPQFYMDKLALDPKTRQVIYLYLNPFQYYMFTFVKYLCDKGKLEENLETQLNVDTLYQRLLAVYCDKFLPVTHNLPIEPNVYYTQSVTPSLNTSSAASSPMKKSSLLKSHVLSASPQSPKSPNSSRFNTSSSPPLNVSTGALSHVAEVWRSELLVHLFTDYWMQADESLQTGFPKPPSRFSQLYRRDPTNQSSLWLVPVFPSGYQIRCIRYIIKHFHQFSSERLQDSSSLGQLRCAVLLLTEARIYSFLEHHITHWPFDCSFKLIQETWFSFIQPWRYASVTQPQDENDVGTTVDRSWVHFIADNIAAYTNLLHLVLDRFLRLDLNNLFNAHLVFRVAKVYSTPNLCALIKEVETELHNDSLNNKFGTPLRQVEIKSRFFSLETTKKVHHIMQRIQLSITHCQELSTPPPSLSLWHSIREELHQFLYSYSVSPSSDANTRLKLRHTICYLSQTMTWFQTIFNIPQSPPVAANPITSADPNFSNSGDHSLNSSALGGSSDTFAFNRTWNMDRTMDNTLVTREGGNVSGQNLTDEVNLSTLAPPTLSRIRNMRYDGDPDLLPISNGEIPFLVRLLYQWSCHLNNAFYDQIQHFYAQNSGISSLLLHATLLPPSTVYKYEQHAQLGVKYKVPLQLPARISLRPFASYSLLTKLAVYSLLVSLFLGLNLGWGLNLSLGMICILLFWLIFNVFKYQVKRMYTPWYYRWNSF